MHSKIKLFAVFILSGIMLISLFSFNVQAANEVNTLRKKFKRLKKNYDADYKKKIENLNKYYELELNKLASKYSRKNNQKGLERVRKALARLKHEKPVSTDNPFSNNQNPYGETINNNPYNNNDYGNTTNNPYNNNYNQQSTYNRDDEKYYLPQNSTLNIPRGSAVLFRGSQYRGRYQMISSPARFNVNALTIGDDSLSSIRVNNDNTMVILYKDRDFSNHVATISENTPSFEKYDDQISSVEVYRFAEIFLDIDFRGSAQKLKVPGEYRDDDIKIGNDELSSLRVPVGVKVILYEHNDFQGQSVTYSAGDHSFVHAFNDRTSSIKVVNE